MGSSGAIVKDLECRYVNFTSRDSSLEIIRTYRHFHAHHKIHLYNSVSLCMSCRNQGILKSRLKMLASHRQQGGGRLMHAASALIGGRPHET